MIGDWNSIAYAKYNNQYNLYLILLFHSSFEHLHYFEKHELINIYHEYQLEKNKEYHSNKFEREEIPICSWFLISFQEQ